MTRPVLADLYCGAGGAAMGYHRAGFDVVGYDIEPQRHYPFEFVQADALDRLADPTFLDWFDAVHTSPPCWSESDLRHRTGRTYRDLLTPTLALLAKVRKPWVVENVDSTRKLPGALMLCGEAFGLGVRCRDGEYRPLRRHRLFASNRWLMGSGCACSGRQPAGVYGTGSGGRQTRGYKATVGEARSLLGITWMTGAEMAQAIPPVYTQHIGEQLLAHLDLRATARRGSIRQAPA